MENPDTRDRLLDAALEAVWPRSYGAVSVDTICKEANVLKGSFYHFFPSKAELMAAGLEHYWQSNQPRFERIFSPPASPLRQIADYFEDVKRRQAKRRVHFGRVVGCPYASIGSEVGHQEPVVGDKIRELIARYCAYFERALRGAQETGEAKISHPKAKARELFALLEGALTQARIHDDLRLLNGLADRAMALIATPKRAAA